MTEPLTAAPALLGYVATTAKGTAVTSLRIGPDRDPLLATWQAGLGTVSSWTSDASAAWSRQWASWDGYVAFWSSVVKDTFAAGDQTGAVDARLGDGVLQIEVADDAPFPDGSSATAVVSGPDGQRVEVVLERAPGDRFVGEVPATRSGSYAVGVTVTSGGRTVLSSSTLADESYPAEFRPATADAAALARLSAQTGGRGEIEPLAAFDSGTLRSGTRSWRLRGALLLLAALVWPIAVVVSRLSLRGVQLADATGGARRLGRRVREAVPKLLPTDPGERPSPSPPIASPPADPTPTTPQPATPRAAPPAGSVNELLARKRARQSGEANDAPGDADTDP
ncbi:MAG: glutamine amidotransferase [Ilumatobacteraceae bacterium]